MKKWVFVFALCLVCTAKVLLAQGDRGVITGIVKDATEAVVPGAQVTAIHVATNTSYKTKTTTSGDFTVPSLRVGVYRVTIERPGFKTHVRDNVLLTAGGSPRVDVQLEVGSTEQKVEVSATAQLLNAETARVSTEVSRTLVEGLPIMMNGGVRSPFALASVTAEVTAGDYHGFRIGGGSAETYGMTLDGNSIGGSMGTNGSWANGIYGRYGDGETAQTNSPSIEALTEFTVEAAGFKAETGHASGGTVTFVSKSGTNAFHGSAYEFLRNQKLDARGFFAAKKAVYKQNDFGITAGGPVWIPKLYHGRDKTFFFVSYEGFRNRVGASVTPLSVAPPEFYTGDLRNWVDANGKQYQIYDPASQRLVGNTYVRDPFQNNQIPQNRIDPISKPILDYIGALVKPNVPNLVPGTSAYVRNNYISIGTTQTPNDKGSFKIDHTLDPKDHISFLFNRTRQKQIDSGKIPAPLGGNPGVNNSDVYRGSWDYTLSPTWLNRFYGGFNNFKQNQGSRTTLKGTPLTEGLSSLMDVGWKEKGICIPNSPDCNAGFPGISTGDFEGVGSGGTNGNDRLVFEVRDDMTKIRGSHTFKWGYYYNDTHYNGFGTGAYGGSMTFNRLSTSVPLDTNAATGGGSGFAAFLLGNVSGYALETLRYLATSYRTHQMYFQDDWRVTPRLTLNLGLRYEINMAPTVGQDQLSDLDPNLRNPAADGIPGAIIFAGYGPGRQNRRSLINNWYGGVGPRLGFAYALNSKTLLRGAASRSYGPVIGAGSASHQIGFVQRQTISDTGQGLNPLWVMKNGMPAWVKPPKIDPSVGNGVDVPYYNGDGATRGHGELTYSFNIQRQLSGSTVLEAGYLATLASNIRSTLLAVNQINYRDLPASLNPFTAAGRTLLNSRMGSDAANAAGIKPPFAAFSTLWGTGNTVAQALRPFPQYSTVNTDVGGGDRLGHSTYHSMMVKLQKRYSAGLTFHASYVLSKALTDAEDGPMDKYNRSLQKSIASYDVTHAVKLTYVYELPLGAGKRYLSGKGWASSVVGGWRIAGVQGYSSGTPMNLATSIGFPIFNSSNRITATTDEGWRAPIAGEKFDPAVDKFLQPASWFGTQPTDRFGNVTRLNPKLRFGPTYSENLSLARIIRIKEELRLEVRCEAFNLLNRTRFGPYGGGTSLQNANFGLWRSQLNQARQMQLALKLYW